MIRRVKTIDVPCSCRGDNAGCVNCGGIGQVRRLACKRCEGTGKTGGECQDCRGQGWRELDYDPAPF